jgi:hypothetical protein
LCTGAAVWACPGVKTVSTPSRQASVVRCAVNRKGEKMQQAEVPRREALAAIAFSGALLWLPGLANAAGLPPGPPAAKLCDVDCEKDLENVSCTAPLACAFFNCSASHHWLQKKFAIFVISAVFTLTIIFSDCNQNAF